MAILTILLYFVLAVAACAFLGYSFLLFSLNDIMIYFSGGVLKYIYIFISAIALLFPIAARKRLKKKWALPIILSAILLIVPVFNLGILKIVEDDLRVFSVEKWDKNENLRIYMLDDLETSYIRNGITDEEAVIDLLGEPTYSYIEGEYMEYYVNHGFIDPIIFYIKLEKGIVVETGKFYS